MSFQLRCPCGTILRSKTSFAGKTVTCPKCQTPLQVKSKPAEANLWTDELPSEVPDSSGSNLLRDVPGDSALSSFPTGPSFHPGSSNTSSRKPTRKTSRLWLALGACGLALGCTFLAVLATRDRNSITDNFRPVAAPSGKDHDNTNRSTESNRTNDSIGVAENPSATRISVTRVSEAVDPITPAIQVAEEFANHARRGKTDLALKMISEDAFDKRLKESPTASWEAIVKRLETPRVLSHLRSKDLESSPLDEGYRHWRVLGETTFQGQDAVLLRYYADPEYPRQWINQTEKMTGLVELLTSEEFQLAAPDLVRYRAKDRHRAQPPGLPDTFGFLPPRFGYLLLLLDSSSGKPQIVDLVSPLGQFPISQMAGAIYLQSWQVIQIGGGMGDTQYKQLLDKANAAGCKAFSIYGTVAKTADLSRGTEWIPAPALWFRPPDAVSPEMHETFDRSVQEWLSQQKPSRTTRLVRIANALNRESQESMELVDDFRRQHPSDPGADLAVISFAMTSLEPRMPASLLPLIDQSAARLFQAFQDPFMLYVRGLSEASRGDLAASSRWMRQANQSGFVAMRMLRTPLENAIARGDKEGAIEAVKQMEAYWKQMELDPASNSEGEFLHLWDIARDKGNSNQQNRSQRNAFTGGRGVRPPDGLPGSAPLGNIAPRSMQPGPLQDGNQPNFGPPNAPPPARRDPGFAVPPGPMPPNSTSPTATGNIQFVLVSQSPMDANAILSSLKEKLRTGNFQMSTSGNRATIQLGFAGPMDEAVRAVDFGKVVQQDEKTRTIHVEVP